MSELCPPSPFSGGILLSYKCNVSCRHCMYACSPKWKGDWISEEDALRVLSQLAEEIRGKYSNPEVVGINYGFHFTGGEPFLKFDLLLELVEASSKLGLPSTFVETNCFWCRSDEATMRKMEELREAGLKGILVSVNPFIVESVPFERTERAVRIGLEVFDRNVIIYQKLFFELFRGMGLKGTISFENFLEEAGGVLRYAELIPAGRAPYKLGYLYARHPARRFFGSSCEQELLRDWHIHIDNYCNYIPGYCAGISLGDARNIKEVCRPSSLKKRPIVRALLSDLGKLYEVGREHGYEEPEEGYVSKCHLCLELRRHLASSGEFQ
ncbi:MAG: radical SAM protein, partial [Candidatus Jordarchaeales archaeon]